eukprot:Skav226692  [mRNA]  locus=scaffold3971:163350:175064:- [translate_table: standard]
MHVDDDGFVQNDGDSQMFTNLHSPTAQFQRLHFRYRLLPRKELFQLSLHSLMAEGSWDSSQLFGWSLIWSNQRGSTGWKDVKVEVPKSTVALRFEIAGSQVSIDAISWGPLVSVPFAYIATGSFHHACVLHTSLGEIRCWGYNELGQLGRSDTQNIGDDPGEMGSQLQPVDLGTNRSAKQLSAGGYHACAILDNDSLKCWGLGLHGQLGYENSDTIGSSPNTMGDHLPAVDLGTGCKAKHVSAGGRHTCAILDNDSLKCWGLGLHGQLGYENSDTIGSSPNTMGDHLPSVDLGTGRKAKHVSAGGYHTCAILDNDSLKCWGLGTDGQLGYESTSEIGSSPNTMGDHLPAVDLGTGRKAKHVSAGRYHTCAVLDNDSLKCWGSGSYGRLGYESTSAIGSSPNTMGDHLPAVDLGTGRKAKHVSAGRYHTCAVLESNAIKCWGFGQTGALGVSDAENIFLGDEPDEMGDRLVPVELGNGLFGEQIAAGMNFNCALLNDDSVKCWGQGTMGRLGQGNEENIGARLNEMGDRLLPLDFGTVVKSFGSNVRIVDGTKLQGRVQVQHQQSWREVCDDNWNSLNAQVVCRQLDLAGGLPLSRLSGSGDFGMDQVACSGWENDLGYCAFRGWGIHDCSSQEAAGVQCQVDAWSSIADPNISARRGHTAIWDSDDDSMLVFAGNAAASFQYYNDLWHFRKDGILVELQAVGPSPRGGHTATWDQGSRMMLVYGGSYFTTYFDELWIYSAIPNSWSLSSPSMKPRARAYHSAVLDVASQMMLIFAGENGVALQDFWQYHLASNTWTELSPSGTPSARSRHSAVWIDVIKAMLVFGGWGDTALNDLWHYSLWTNAWTQLFSGAPSSRAGHKAFWEPLTWSMLTFAGVRLDESLNYTAEVWNYSLLTNSWTPLAPVGPYPAPGPREDHSIVWDPKSYHAYLFGGFDATYKSDIWRYRSMDLEEVPVRECFLGQECQLEFEDRSPEEMLQVADFFRFTDVFYFSTLDGFNFSLVENATDNDDSERAEYDNSDNDTSDSGGPFLLVEPGLYRISHCSANFTCEGHWFELGMLLVVGPFSGQSFVCDLGSHCLVEHLKGFRLSSTDQLLPLKECGSSLETLTFSAQPISASVHASVPDVFDFGQLDCMAHRNECNSAGVQRTVQTLGNFVLWPCSWTWRGYFDSQGVCSLCLGWHFKNETGPGLCQSCPQQSISGQGAISLQECYCPPGTIDIDSGDMFNCVDVLLLGDAVSNTSFALTETMMYTFTGVASVPGSSDSLEVQGVQDYLLSYLSLSSRASLLVESESPSRITYKITTSEEEEAMTLHAKMDPSVFKDFAITATAMFTTGTQLSIATERLRCPEGMGFVGGTLIRAESDCKCIQGMEPVEGESGLTSGCKKCPQGRYKSLIADVACSSCGGLTTLLEGAVSSSSCTCPAGFVNEVVDDPTNCQPCGRGFFCSGGKHKEACGESLTTATETASEASECICDSGFFRSMSTCQPCPKGRFKADIGDGSCQACPAGRWNNQSAASHQDACNLCMPGSTTRESGAEDESLCVRPEPAELHCTSGTVCAVEISGFQLQNGHRLALTKSSCDAPSAVSGVVAEGISMPATFNGSRYVWGDTLIDFHPEGGVYNLCWCANMRDLSCVSLRANFIVFAGQLEVIGPLANHSFECVRGQDCSGLTAFQGHSLSSQNQVALRNACGGSEPLSVASGNPNGTGSLSSGVDGGELSIAFGEVLMDADEGYAICWCARACDSAEAFAVPAGYLRVLGPYANQRANCFLGQLCILKDIKGVALMAGDQIMLRTDCETGTCTSPLDFKASLGFFTAHGPFQVKTVCLQGHLCTWQLLGIGLTAGDRLVFRDHGCQAWSLSNTSTTPSTPSTASNALSTLNFQMFMESPEPVATKLKDGALQVDLGILPFGAKPGPGTYQICWCPSHLPCTSPQDYRSSAGDLQIDCPPGEGCSRYSSNFGFHNCFMFYSFVSHGLPPLVSAADASGPPKNRFYCSGGSINDASKTSCAAGETTLDWSSTSSSECICMPGYTFVDGECAECPAGFYKASAGNQPCTSCPDNTTTFSSKASSEESCIAETVLSSAPGESELNESLTNTFAVPTMSFSLSMVASSNEADAINAVVATVVRSMLGTAAVVNVETLQVDQGDPPTDPSRRMSMERISVVTLKYMTMQEANASVQGLDLNVTSDAIFEALHDAKHDISNVQAFGTSVSLVPLTCPESALVPPGIPVRDVEDCVCRSGYEQNLHSNCTVCANGQYKGGIGNENCNLCPIGRTTANVGSTSLNDCVCQAGTFDDEGECSDCKLGFFCPGSGKAEICPTNTASLVVAARSIDNCLCTAGFSLNGNKCEHCAPGRFKTNVGNEPCTQLCPPNANSYPGARSLDDCFCIKDHHAVLASNGQLDRCASCASYVGVTCQGGFDLNSSLAREHSQPRAAVGFYQTGSIFASKCRVVLPDGSSACRGENICGEGTTGMLCGECPLGWARSEDFSPCDACLQGASAMLSTAVLFDISKIAVSNFVLAALAAGSSANANLPLHTYMIRVLTQWFTACALITHFNLELLETPFSQSIATSADCDQQGPSRDVMPAYDRGGNDILDNFRLQLAWPPAVSRALTTFFDVVKVLPKFTSVKFSAQCCAFELFPDRPDAQRLAPALYYISLPILTMLATYAVCAVMVYGLVPVARHFGIHLNKVAAKQHKRRKHLIGLFGNSMRSIPLPDVPLDLPKHHNLNTFAAKVLESHESFARQLCKKKCSSDPQLEDLLADAEISFETFEQTPTAFLFAEFSKEDIQTVSCLQ